MPGTGVPTRQYRDLLRRQNMAKHPIHIDAAAVFGKAFAVIGI